MKQLLITLKDFCPLMPRIIVLTSKSSFNIVIPDSQIMATYIIIKKKKLQQPLNVRDHF